MGSGTGLLLWLVFTAVTLYALFVVVRAGVEAGIRRVLPDSPPSGGRADTSAVDAQVARRQGSYGC